VLELAGDAIGLGRRGRRVAERTPARRLHRVVEVHTSFLAVREIDRPLEQPPRRRRCPEGRVHVVALVGAERVVDLDAQVDGE